MPGAEPRRCAFCRLPINPGEPAYRLAPGFYPREDPTLFLEDDDITAGAPAPALDAHVGCLMGAIGGRVDPSSGGT